MFQHSWIKVLIRTQPKQIAVAASSWRCLYILVGQVRELIKYGHYGTSDTTWIRAPPIFHFGMFGLDFKKAMFQHVGCGCTSACRSILKSDVLGDDLQLTLIFQLAICHKVEWV